MKNLGILMFCVIVFMGAYVSMLEIYNTELSLKSRFQDSIRSEDSTTIYVKTVQIFKLDSLRESCGRHSKYPVYQND